MAHRRLASTAVLTLSLLRGGLTLADPVEPPIKCPAGDPAVYLKKGSKVFIPQESPDFGKHQGDAASNFVCRSKALKQGARPATAP